MPPRALSLLLVCVSLHAAKLPVRHYTAADGLPRDSIHCILRDPEGFLWFATGEGIARFDGYGFHVYRVADGLPDRDVRAISSVDDGSFILSTGGGATRFQPDQPAPAQRFQDYLLPDNAQSRSVNAGLVTGPTVWLGTDAGLYVVRGPASLKAEPFLLPAFPATQPQVNAIVRDSARRVWVGTTAGLFLIDPAEPAVARLVTVSGAAPLPSSSIWALLAEGDAIWAGTTRGLAKFRLASDAPGRYHVKLDGGVYLPGNEVRSILRAREGSVWAGTRNGAARLTPGAAQFQKLGQREGFDQGDAPALAEDARGDIWVGYDGAGAIRLSSRDSFITYDDADGLPAAQVTTLTLTREGAPLVTTWSGPGFAVWRYAKEHFERVPVSPSAELFPEDFRPWHQALLDDRLGGWWSGSQLGLLCFQPPVHAADARLRSQYRKSEGLPAENVAHVFQDSKGNIWFSTLPLVAYPPPGVRSGLGMLNRSTGSVRAFSEADGLPPLGSVAILYLAEDHAGQIWIGLYRSGVARLRNGRFEVLTTADGIPAGGIRYIYEDSRHRLWLASGRGGLGCIEDPTALKPAVRRYTTETGLASDEIQTITEDRFGRIYAGTGLGVDRLDPATGRIVHYTTANGLAPGEVQDSIRDLAGDLWFGTYKAVSRLHPLPDPAAESLAARIAAVRVNGRPAPANYRNRRLAIRDIAAGSNSIEIEYFALAVSGTENVRYQHRLQGADEAWSAAAFNRTTLYDNLRPGHYVFEARSLNPAPGEAVALEFEVLPFYWERWWFWATCAGVLCSIAYGFHRYRLSHILRLQAMRTRLARDLHDDIGSSLSKIAIMSEVASRQAADPAALDRIAETSREVLDAVGDLVWATSASAERFEDLIRRMRSFATQLFEAQGAGFVLIAEGVPLQKSLNPEWVRQVYLIFKEAANNAAKHANCTVAKAEVCVKDNALTLRLIDNGTGFSLVSKPGHHGLDSLRSRAKYLGGHIEWRSENGTIVELHCPLRD